MEEDLKELIQILIEGQIRTDKSVNELAALAGIQAARFDHWTERLNEAHARTEAAIASLAVTVDKYVAASDARMKRLEENLDGLIRAITREHTNGKAH